MDTKTSQRFRHVLLPIIACLFFYGCARLPQYAQPHMSSQQFDDSLVYIDYRLLRREDFRAKVPAPAIRDHQHMINAHTSVSLRPVHDIGYIISPPHLNFGLYKVYLQQLGFKAVMIPERSWWNPQLAESKSIYVLQHEQIHFALMEIAARRVNKFFATPHTSFVSGTDRQTVLNRLQKLIDKKVDATKKAILQEHTKFDEQTSLYHDPVRQQEWYEDCQKQLLQLEKWAK